MMIADEHAARCAVVVVVGQPVYVQCIVYLMVNGWVGGLQCCSSTPPCPTAPQLVLVIKMLDTAI